MPIFESGMGPRCRTSFAASSEPVVDAVAERAIRNATRSAESAAGDVASISLGGAVTALVGETTIVWPSRSAVARRSRTARAWLNQPSRDCQYKR